MRRSASRTHRSKAVTEIPLPRSGQSAVGTPDPLRPVDPERYIWQLSSYNGLLFSRMFASSDLARLYSRVLGTLHARSAEDEVRQKHAR